ncbi:hypothetical protein [Cellulomonas dongxiuzhuiae]|uniref:TIGR04222 domain-containing membrane protein n=1 Tax=Cellulomonas dongxiuzhuiae TaxID=2819979 RepID=A0ABX8GLD0_9CELL|nr:hypothetical protein [Cellulomonas dongxiuzhuiae]MBO3096439.1 hypothetical protein [Cellulomonas dongxiuzhuiae]QWC16845.1 hypothetical protein KKR89_04185 [Cellulomonas dongxiuzhuiae]
MNGLAGLVALALVGLWAAYLVPHHLRHRQRLLEARTDDRFSAGLRVVAVASSTRRRLGRRAAAAGMWGPSTTALLTPGTGVPAAYAGTLTGGTTVDRPHATPERISAEAARRLAQARAARAASAARRGAAARRRGLLAAVLVVASVAGWVVAGVAPAATWLLGAVPTALLASVVVLGRRAVIAGHVADAEWVATIHREERLASSPRTGATPAVRPRTGATPAVRADAEPGVPVPLVTGHAVRPSDAHTEVFERIVEDRGESTGPARHATGQVPVVRGSSAPAAQHAPADAPDDQRDGEWSPVRVPRPTYAMKAPAPRRTPAPLAEPDAEASTVRRPADAPSDEVAPAAREAQPSVVEPSVETTGSIDLNAVLARRRAAGQ